MKNLVIGQCKKRALIYAHSCARQFLDASASANITRKMSRSSMMSKRSERRWKLWYRLGPLWKYYQHLVLNVARIIQKLISIFPYQPYASMTLHVIFPLMNYIFLMKWILDLCKTDNCSIHHEISLHQFFSPPTFIVFYRYVQKIS